MSSVALPRPAERLAIISLVLVFLCGAVAGALVMRWTERAGFVQNQHTQTALPASADEWRRQLDLTDAQTRQLDSILDDFGRYYDNLLADGQTRIRQILNDEQRKKFNRMIEGRRAH